jgi:hypothetical protein
MRPILRDPETVRLGDWLDLFSYGAPVYTRIGRLKNTAIAGAILIISSFGLMLGLRSGVTLDAEVPAAVAGRGGAFTVHNAISALRDGFVDDWTFVYPAPQNP